MDFDEFLHNTEFRAMEAGVVFARLRVNASQVSDHIDRLRGANRGKQIIVMDPTGRVWFDRDTHIETRPTLVKYNAKTSPFTMMDVDFGGGLISYCKARDTRMNLFSNHGSISEKKFKFFRNIHGYDPSGFDADDVVVHYDYVVSAWVSNIDPFIMYHDNRGYNLVIAKDVTFKISMDHNYVLRTFQLIKEMTVVNTRRIGRDPRFSGDWDLSRVDGPAKVVVGNVATMDGEMVRGEEISRDWCINGRRITDTAVREWANTNRIIYHYEAGQRKPVFRGVDLDKFKRTIGA